MSIFSARTARRAGGRTRKTLKLRGGGGATVSDKHTRQVRGNNAFADQKQDLLGEHSLVRQSAAKELVQHHPKRVHVGGERAVGLHADDLGCLSE